MTPRSAPPSSPLKHRGDIDRLIAYDKELLAILRSVDAVPVERMRERLIAHIAVLRALRRSGRYRRGALGA